MLIKDLYGKNILIWGMGAEGNAANDYLQKHKMCNNIMFYNDSDGEQKLEEMLAKTDVIIRSPGVSIYKPQINKAKKRNIQISSCSDLFLAEMRANHPKTKIIGISGSKGKSTSSSMLFHIIKSGGNKVALGGNIGKPLIEIIDEDYDFVVCEFSSYQASDLTASPNIALFTNLFSVHTDWHEGHDNYCKDKLHLVANQSDDDICIINFNNSQLREYSTTLRNVQYYGEHDKFHAEGKYLYYGKECLISIDDLRISGNHNIDNLAGVMTVVDLLGLDIRLALEALKSFSPLPHRLQKVCTINNIEFINDSISTAPEAAIGAMQSFDCDIVIISGGIENHQDYQQYAKFIEHNPKIKGAATLFQCGPQIANDIRQFVKRPGFDLLEAKTLEEAVEFAYKKLKKTNGGLVLFSPTAPSFGYYKNFMERGEHFIKIVKSLEK